MQNTDNFDLKIYEGEDLFNPLVVENANAQAIDTQMKKNENHTVGDATELVSGTVHALTRLTPDTPMLRFTATSRFTAGDTFTVDGVQVSALTVSGEQLPDGAYIIGSEVLAYLKGTLLTFFTSQGTLATAQNALKLGGNTPEYYATATAVQQAQDTATAAGNLANKLNSNLEEYKFLPRYDAVIGTMTSPSQEYTCVVNSFLIGTIKAVPDGWASVRSMDNLNYYLALETTQNETAICIPFKKGDVIKLGSAGIYNLGVARAD